MSVPNKVKQKIINAKTILITCHINPDGDAIGSMLALGLGLQQLGKRVVMVSADGVPRIYRSLPAADQVVRRTSGKADLAIAVDCNLKEMIGVSFQALKRAGDILEIDHHEFRQPFGTLSYIDEKAAAVGELIYTLLRSLGVCMTKEIAQNILTSLIVETNSFRLPQIRPFTFRVCAAMLKTGIDFQKLTNMVYWVRTRESVLLTGLCLSRCRFLKDGRIVWSILHAKDFRKAKGRHEDVDAVADEMRAIQGVKAAILFREVNKKTLRVSLRSKGHINIASVARQFSGGGHFDIAGCFIANNTQEIRRFLRQVEKLFE